MKNFKLYFLTAFLIILGLFNNSYSQAKTFDEALKLAKSENKKVIVDIYTDWCVWCKKMDKDSYGNKDIIELIEDNFIVVKLDAEGSGKSNYKGKTYDGAGLAALFEATGYPTTVFLKSNGDVIEFKYDKYKMNNLPGYYGAKDFKKILEFIIDEKYKDTDLSTIL
jgi:thioredoxin-related protein